MTEFEKTTQIKVDINSKESIENAISLYQNEIMEVVEFNHEFPIEFINIDGTKLKGKQINNKEILKNYIYYIKTLKWSKNITHYTEFLSEEIFFAIALEHGFKDKVVDVAKTIISVTDGSDHFSLSYVSERRPFGFGVLYLLSLIYPEETYLLTSYMGSSWDDEHCDNIRSLVIERIWNLDFSRDAIKAFAYCDYYYLRQDIHIIPSYKKIYWHPNFNEYYYDVNDFNENDFIKPRYLWDHFINNHSDYEYFIDNLKFRVHDLKFNYDKMGDSIYDIFDNIIPTSYREELEKKNGVEYFKADDENLLSYSYGNKTIDKEIKSLKKLYNLVNDYDISIDYFSFSFVTLEKLRDYLMGKIKVNNFEVIENFRDLNAFLYPFKDFSKNQLNKILISRLLDLLFHVGKKFPDSIFLLIDERYFNYLSEEIKKLYSEKISDIKNFRNDIKPDLIVDYINNVVATGNYLNYLLITLIYNNNYKDYQIGCINILFDKFGKELLHDNFNGRHMDLKKLIDCVNK